MFLSAPPRRWDRLLYCTPAWHIRFISDLGLHGIKSKQEPSCTPTLISDYTWDVLSAGSGHWLCQPALSFTKCHHWAETELRSHIPEQDWFWCRLKQDGSLWLHTVLEVGLEQCRTEWDNPFLSLAGCAVLDALQGPIGLLGSQGTRSTHIQLATNSNP